MPSLNLSLKSRNAADQLLDEAVQSKRLPPSFLVALDAERTLYSRCSGDGLDEKDTVLKLFSMTKLVTSIAALQLVDRGLLQLSTDVGLYVPSLASPSILCGFDDGGEPILVPSQTKVTLLHLLNHSSGLALEAFYPKLLPRWRKWAGLAASPAARDDKHFTQPLVFEPGTSYCYGPSTDFVGRVVEAVSGLPLETYFRRHILDPLGMSSTSFELSPDLAGRCTLATHLRLPLRDVISPISQRIGWSMFAKLGGERLHLGGQGLYGTVDDYSLLLRHLLQLAPTSPVSPSCPRLLSPRSWESLFQPTLGEGAVKGLEKFRPSPAGEGDVQWSTALCLNKRDWEGMRRAGSGNWSGMANTYFVIDPTTGIALLGGTQLFEPEDRETNELIESFERIIFEGLSSREGKL